MKILTLAFLVLLSHDIYSQKSIFVRVYDLTGKKVNKGHVLTVTDTSLQLQGKSVVDIPAHSIGSIKTRHSGGNNVLVGSIIGMSSMAIVGAASANPDAEILGFTAGESAGIGALFGLHIGAAIGGFTILFKKSKTFSISGDMMSWKAFQSWATGK